MTKMELIVGVFLVAIVVTSARASPLEGRLLKDDAEGYPVDDADYDMSGDDEEWPEGFLERGEPSEVYLQEVREQLENRSIPQTEPLTRSKRHIIPAIRHQSTIALQYVLGNRNWLSCWSGYTKCKALTCPGLYMTANDWNTCGGEVFRIYRASGVGAVRVGDLVGIYYPSGQKWLGCAVTYCSRRNCPGSPSLTYGFQSQERWYRCYEEVFKIYARGKYLGQDVQEHDQVLLFHLQHQRWLSLYELEAQTLPCPGLVRPPPISKYEQCWEETLEIWQK